MKGSKEKENVTASFNILFVLLFFIFSLLRQCDYSKYSVVLINKLGINQI